MKTTSSARPTVSHVAVGKGTVLYGIQVNVRSPRTVALVSYGALKTGSRTCLNISFTTINFISPLFFVVNSCKKQVQYRREAERLTSRVYLTLYMLMNASSD